MVRYFELDPLLNRSYDQVWRWIDWPERKGKPDTGIDLVARERDTGDLTAIQCKFYEPTHTLVKGRHRLVLHRLGQSRRSPTASSSPPPTSGVRTLRTRWPVRASRSSGSAG